MQTASRDSGQSKLSINLNVAKSAHAASGSIECHVSILLYQLIWIQNVARHDHVYNARSIMMSNYYAIVYGINTTILKLRPLPLSSYIVSQSQSRTLTRGEMVW